MNKAFKRKITSIYSSPLVMGCYYKCVANDIVSQWDVTLQYLGRGEWSHDTENFEGTYPPLVHYIGAFSHKPDVYSEPYFGMTDAEYHDAYKLSALHD